ncbi:glycosyltransferase [Agrococcus carbonis]|uniref:Rhamnosyltransferase n=1 Tax=Agrococcus carbonis TaxID=684552 RepID=A0A1H1M550_9MICO|nr:glycosyltransferase [Agrococcus carbonis]SDR81908.1 rhamnosyltransferase [Agrococcus carbonis]
MTDEHTERASATPLVAVLMATHNGEEFIEEQVRTILDQQGVEVRIVVSDDASTDATLEILRGFGDDRITLLEPGRFGTPQANFLRLIRDADVTGATAVALADQDDRWHLDRFQRQLALIAEHRLDAISSSVTAFWTQPDGSEVTEYLEKSQPQVELDYLLESAGPGCTFVLTASTFATVREVVAAHPLVDESVPHDWIVYAIARATDRRWRIDPTPTIDYRQHGANATGANKGLRAALSRARRLASGDYRTQCAAIARLAASLATGPTGERLERIAPLFERSDFASRAALRRLVPELRREPAERRWLDLVLRLGIW